MKRRILGSAVVWMAAVMLTGLPAAALAFAGPAGSNNEAKITYRRVFKDSTPEFIEVRVSASGSATYDIRSLSDDPEPREFEISPALAAKIYELAEKLDYFRDQKLDVRRRIANLGEKTFRYERGTDAWETTFNYTINQPASQLMAVFEGLARQQEHYDTLERRLKFDRLGLQKALFSFEMDLNRKILPEPERLVPVLERIAMDDKVVDIARQRARSLVERLRISPS